MKDKKKYPLVYPASGSSIVVRPMFNPASGQIVNQISHWDKKAILQMIEETGQCSLPQKKLIKVEGICYAQFLSSDPAACRGTFQEVLQPGDIILLLFPHSVLWHLREIIRRISRTPGDMDHAFGFASSGLCVQITVSPDRKEYTVKEIPDQMIPTEMTDDEYIEMIDGMAPLTDKAFLSMIAKAGDIIFR